MQQVDPADLDLNLGVYVVLDADRRVVSISKKHSSAERNAWKLWKHIPGMSFHVCHVQESLAPMVKRGMQLEGTTPFVEITDPRRVRRALAVFDLKTAEVLL